MAPLSGVIVHAIGDKAGWNQAVRQHAPKLDVETCLEG